jgi:hypothetical protein
MIGIRHLHAGHGFWRRNESSACPCAASRLPMNVPALKACIKMQIYFFASPEPINTQIRTQKGSAFNEKSERQAILDAMDLLRTWA